MKKTPLSVRQHCILHCISWSGFIGRADWQPAAAPKEEERVLRAGAACSQHPFFFKVGKGRLAREWKNPEIGSEKALQISANAVT
jgi:hypothetical protein